MNVFSAVARLGAEPEQKHTASGDSVVTFNGAVDSGFGDKKATTWIRYSIWGKRGESVLPYLAKGNQVAVSGELTNREWTDKEGQKRYSLEVRVNDLTLIGGKKADSEGAGFGKYNPRQKSPENKPKPVFDDLGDDIPF